MAEKSTKRQSRKLGDPIPVRMLEETEIMISAIAKQRGESNQEVIRRILDRGAKEEMMLTFGADELLALVRKAVMESTKPFEERIAKLTAKATIASATAMYTNLEVIGQLGRKDPRPIHTEARKKAISYVRSSNDALDQAAQDGEDVDGG